jgi:hypothetical protein
MVSVPSENEKKSPKGVLEKAVYEAAPDGFTPGLIGSCAVPIRPSGPGRCPASDGWVSAW